MLPVLVNCAELLPQLRAAGLTTGSAVRWRALPGGVSSDIHLVETTDARFVVKAALPKLRVRDPWVADVSRNRVEQAYFEYAARVVPDSVPRILGGAPEHGWFAMEYLGGGFANWKLELLAGRASRAVARLAGETLGRLHDASWRDPVAGARFDTLRNFHALRIEPYLLSTASRVPAVRPQLRMEARRLAETRLALVHGDYSPKNLLVGRGRMVVLDAECGWFGDPAFDTAFLLTHLHLKALFHARNPRPMLALVPAFWSGYTTALGSHASSALEQRTVRLLLMLLLARVHGKSPVEYLAEKPERDFVTDFTTARLQTEPPGLADLTAVWAAEIERLGPTLFAGASRRTRRGVAKSRTRGRTRVRA